ncbi:Sodium-dependent serotonin transporter [Holothuria leucospilota]|uniref:Transporter n=1 Tax=Holothuria leucospilota TaxID=206669 RepID=A0A9Q1CBG5_HOLLE|nr:Sodium-dependent serotonin transporter [Holothuria leucospilota]
MKSFIKDNRRHGRRGLLSQTSSGSNVSYHNGGSRTKELSRVTSTASQRDTWSQKTDYLLSLVGFAVDLGNIWRFPYVCYQNGGGAFLIPYVLMAFLCGVPLFYLELALGQYQRTGCVTVWSRLCPVFEGVGYAIILVNIFVSFYYNTVIAWSLYYLLSTFTSSVLPWTTCGNPWNTDNCRSLYDQDNVTQTSNDTVSPAAEFFERKVLKLHLSSGLGDVGPIKWDLMLCLLAVYIAVYFSLWKGIRGSGKVVWVTATLPYICLVVLLIRGVSLQGAGQGITYYLKPRWELLLDAGVWVAAATQVFFSLGPGFGVLLAFASYNKLHNNCYRDTLVVSAINCFTSFFSGFAIFSFLGYMAYRQNTSVENVATDGPGLVFIAYPEAIATLPGSHFWSILFFIMLITLGLDSTFGGLESIITGISDKFPFKVGNHRELFVAGLVTFSFAGALSTVTYGGQYVIQFLDAFGAGTTLLLVVILEAIIITWFYGIRRFVDNVYSMLGFKPSMYWIVCWCFVSPAFLLFVVIFALISYSPLEFNGYVYPQWSIALGWSLTASSMMWVPAFGLYKFIITPGSFQEVKYVQYNELLLFL